MFCFSQHKTIASSCHQLRTVWVKWDQVRQRKDFQGGCGVCVPPRCLVVGMPIQRGDGIVDPCTPVAMSGGKTNVGSWRRCGSICPDGAPTAHCVGGMGSGESTQGFPGRLRHLCAMSVPSGIDTNTGRWQRCRSVCPSGAPTAYGVG